MREGCCYINVDAQEVAAMDPLLYRWGEGRRVCEGFCTVVLWGGGGGERKEGGRGGGSDGSGGTAWVGCCGERREVVAMDPLLYK
jgi:hypothetical protein